MTDKCFWCGDYEDRDKAFEEGVSSETVYAPCGGCKKLFSQGIALLEARETPMFKNQPSASKNFLIYPTQRHWVVTPMFMRSVYRSGYAEAAIADGRAFIDKASFESLLNAMMKTKKTVQ